MEVNHQSALNINTLKPNSIYQSSYTCIKKRCIPASDVTIGIQQSLLYIIIYYPPKCVKMVFFASISSAVKTKDSRDTTHLQLSACLQLLDLAMQVRPPKHWASVSPGDGGMGLRVFQASLGTILWNKQLIVLQVKSWVLQNVQIMIEIWFWYQCAWCLSCPNLGVPKSRVCTQMWVVKVPSSCTLLLTSGKKLLSTTSSIRQGGCHLGIIAWCLVSQQNSTLATAPALLLPSGKQT